MDYDSGGLLNIDRLTCDQLVDLNDDIMLLMTDVYTCAFEKS